MQRVCPAPREDNFSLRQSVVVTAIGALGPDTVPALIVALRDRNADVRATAAWSLASLGPPARAAVPALVGALADPNALVRLHAAGALGNMQSAAVPAVPALIGALKDDELGPGPGRVTYVRGWAASALGKIGPPARAAVPALTELLHDPSSFHRVQAAIALWRIDREVAATLPVLLEALEQRGESSKWAVIEVLGEMGARAQAAVPALSKLVVASEAGNARAFADFDPTQAREALRKIDPQAENEVPAERPSP